jgi:hypothetical protein
VISLPGSHSPKSKPTSSFPSATTTPGALSKRLSLTVLLSLAGCFCPSLCFRKELLLALLFSQQISRDAILAIMELDWFCTGVLELRHPCLMRAFHELFSLLEKQQGSP